MEFAKSNDTQKHALWARATAVAVAVVLTAGLAACDNKPAEPTVGQKLDAAVAKTESAAGEAKQKMEEAAQDASAAAQNAASNAAVALDDTAITTKVKSSFAADPNLSAVLISVETKDGVVTLSGPVKTPADKTHAVELTKAVEGVKGVVDKLVPSNG